MGLVELSERSSVLSFERRQAGRACLKKLPVLRACRGSVYIAHLTDGGKCDFGGL
jgi:hypothetical protein